MSTYDRLVEQKYSHDIELASKFGVELIRLIARFSIDGGYALRFYVRNGTTETEHSGLAAACRAYDSFNAWMRG